MQFVRHGPDIPERLLQAHEDGRVVFFCGAGISVPAGLPEFSKLVGRLFAALGESPNAIQQAAIKARQYDTAIGLLEAAVAGGRDTVRRELESILAPNLGLTGATSTHEALLRLARTRDGRVRLVTTNFDRLFAEVLGHGPTTVEVFRAPLLPVPKHRWNGLVYLHGLLPVAPTPGDLDRLVMSSGDFGLAYLTERWAARFVSELFRSCTVCFVGYSINDPVLRYMMDALAADRLLGESPPEMFAFGAYRRGKDLARADEWRAKNVTPVLYLETKTHDNLHKTLAEWANTYRDGVRGKERIVVESAGTRPIASTRQDDFVGRALWALSDPGGLPAMRFADLDPVPPLDWLVPLCDPRFHHHDLVRFGVPPRSTADDTLAFSLLCRPAPYDKAPYMQLAGLADGRSRWDAVMSHIARWLTRHIDDPQLVLWLSAQGGHLDSRFATIVERRLADLDQLARTNQSAELERIRAAAPRAVPGPLMLILWRLLLAGRLGASGRDGRLYGWQEKFARTGLTPTLRMELRELLAPRVRVSQLPPLSIADANRDDPSHVTELVRCEITLSTDPVHAALPSIRQTPSWEEALLDLLPEFSALLRDTLDLMREVGLAGPQSDLTYIHQPSISAHAQNRAFSDWTALIELTRDAWIATHGRNLASARAIAEAWWQAPYPVFKRLAFFAAAHSQTVPTRDALTWLIADDRWWLWSIETEREATRLLVALTPVLDGADLLELERAVIAGPPRAMYREDLATEEWEQLRDREIWVRLAKMAAAVTTLGTPARERLNELSAQYPQWRLAPDDSDEFSYWLSDGDALRQSVTTPRRRRELVQWIREHPSAHFMHGDDWQQRCRNDFATTACALAALARDGVWPVERWREALQAWSEDKLILRSWRRMAPILASASDEFLGSIAHGVSWWLKSVARTFPGSEQPFLALCRRILSAPLPDGIRTDDPVMQAINQPVGHVTDALLRWWYRTPLEDGQLLPPELAALFAELCDVRVNKYRHCRVLLSAHLIALFRVDRTWATTYLCPLLDWRTSEDEARAAWDGFLWSPRLYRPLMEVLKNHFLETARRYSLLGKHGEQYAALLALAALDPRDLFSRAELAAATRSLPSDGLRDTSRALYGLLEGAGDLREEYWAHRLAPYLRFVWPRSRDRITKPISENLARLCIASGQAFPDAMELLRHWLQPVEYPHHLIHELHKAGLCRSFPEASLAFLESVIGDAVMWLPTELGSCLESIKASAPGLEADARFERLTMLFRQHGQR